jgi:hypothetical protein
MGRKRYSAEEIVNRLRQADVKLARSKTVSVVCKQIGITDETHFHWRKEYGGLHRRRALQRYSAGSESVMHFSATAISGAFIKVFQHRPVR